MIDDGKTRLEDYSGLKIDLQTRQECDLVEFENIIRASRKYLLGRVSPKKAPFTYDWFLQVHCEMLGDVWDWAGTIRDSNLNIGIDKTQIREELRKLADDYAYWTTPTSDIDPEEICARLHHRLVWVHPFKNGNGRWARLITNIHRRKSNLPLYQWPEKALLEQSNFRNRYLQALKAADDQNFGPLMKIHQELVQKAN